jgi:esterase/lipase
MKSFLRILLILLGFLGGLYFFGPKPAEPSTLGDALPEIKTSLADLDSVIAAKESKVPGIKPNNEAKVVWFDSTKKAKTPYAFVYIHGFSASQMEGDPVHQNLAKRFGANLYLARMEGHGVDVPSNFKNLTADQLLTTAREAIAIGKTLGDKVIVIATSMGGVLTLQMAAENPDLAGLILYSPCVAIFDPTARLLDDPWGFQIAKFVKKGEENIIPDQEPASKLYWTKRYHLNGVVAIENALEATMTAENFAKIKQPVFLGYYYKDEQHQDNIVSVPAMLKMYDQLGTSAAQKRKVAFPESGDHVIASSIKSKDWKSVEAETIKFAEEILKLSPISKQ